MDKLELAVYIGRGDGHEEISAQPLRALSATLDRDPAAWNAGDPVPAAWQWLYFLPETPQSLLEADGHPRRGGSLPAASSTRRMFAGARMTFHRPLRVGARVYRESSVLDVARKQGRAGSLVFVTLRFVYRDDEGPVLEEEQDIVFRETGRVEIPSAIETEPPAAQWNGSITTDPVLLFRFSALTFNAHRIHYDQSYALQEGYPGLLVHGPLVAILLLELAARNAGNRKVGKFSFRAHAPICSGTRIALRGDPDRNGKRAVLGAWRCDGVRAMSAEIAFTDNGGAPLAAG